MAVKLVLKMAQVFLAVIAISVVIVTHSLMLAFPGSVDNQQMQVHSIINLMAGLMLLTVFYHAAYVMFRGF